MTKISQLPSVGDSLAIDDQFVIRDVSDASNPNKSITISGIARGLTDGSASAPALAFAADKNTGIYRPGADQVAISTNGTGRLFIDASGNVNIDSGTLYLNAGSNRVGVNTDSPQTSLQVGGADTGALQDFITLSRGGYPTANFRQVIAAACSSGGPGNNSIAFKVSDGTNPPDTRMIITGGNLVGIGTTGPSETLAVKGATGVNPFSVSGPSSEFLRVDSSGRLGLKTSTPSSLLEVDRAFKVKTVNTTTIANERGITIYNNQSDGLLDSTLVYGNSANSYFALGHHDGTGYSERLRITSDGKLGLGTSSPSATLQVAGANNGTQALFGNGSLRGLSVDTFNTVAIDNSGVRLVVNQTTEGAFEVSTGGSPRLRINQNGNVGIGTTSPSRTFEVSGSGTTTRLTSSTSTSTLEFSTTGGFAYIGAKDGPNVYVETNGSERLRVDSSGRLLVGTSTVRSVGSPFAPQFQLESPNSGIAGLTVVTNRGDTLGPAISLAKSRGGSVGSTTIVADGDALGELRFCGADGTDIETVGARISAQVDGTPGANDMPGRLVFSTTADGASSPTERLRITSDAYVRLASGTGGIQFNGDTAAANALDDYEEGTWTPLFTDGTNNATMAAGNVGKYTKIGNTVHAQCDARCSAINSMTGDVRLSGLPFVGVSAYIAAATVGGALGLAITAGQSVSAYIPGASSYLFISLFDLTTGTSLMQETELSDNGRLYVNVTYQVS